MSLTQFILF